MQREAGVSEKRDAGGIELNDDVAVGAERNRYPPLTRSQSTHREMLSVQKPNAQIKVSGKYQPKQVKESAGSLQGD